MEKQILLGTEGSQPFKIGNSGVSRRHARIVINDNGCWTLEDLNSTNGTFIRDDSGDLRRIASITITPITMICLGPNNANGCTFYARQAVGQDNFTEEFELLNDIEDRFDAKEAKADTTARNIRLVITVTSLLALTGSFLTERGSDMQLIMLRLGSLISLLSSALYNPSDKKKKITDQREKFHNCPNPKCTHILSTKEIRMMQCTKCKAH